MGIRILRVKRLLAGILLLSGAGCGWIQDYRLRAQATTQATEELRAQLTKEFRETLGDSFARENDYVASVLGETSVEILSVGATEGPEVPVTLKIRTVSSQVRHDLREIIRPLRDRQLNAFNFDDARRLIEQRGVPAREEQEKHLALAR